VLLMVRSICSFCHSTRSVGARKAKQNAMTRQEARHGVINELSAIVSLKATGNKTKLSLNISNKINKMTINFGFLMQQKGLAKMTEIIKHDQIIFITRSAKDGRCPHITINQRRRF